MNQSPRKMMLSMSTGIGYIFTGSDRSANKSSLADFSMVICDTKNALKDLSTSTGLERILFNKGQKVVIKRARLVSKAAPGLMTASTLAGNFLVGAGKPAPAGSITTAPKTLAFANWNTWEEKDFELTIEDDGSTLWMVSGSAIYLDDFNVQDDYVGQEVSPYIEAEAEVYIGG